MFCEIIKPKRLFILILVNLIIYSCAPKAKDILENLELSIPADWEIDIPMSDTLTGDWWSVFQDSKLDNFISEIRLNNPDLKSIMYKHEIAMQTARQNGANIFPIINSILNGNISNQNMANFTFAESLFNNDSSDEVVTFSSETYIFNLSLQWEVDIWGRALNARKAAYKDYEATKYELAYIGFSTIIRSIQTYYQGLESVRQLELAKENFNHLMEIRNLVEERYNKGIKTSLDLMMAESYLASAKVQIENRKIELNRINRLLNSYKGKYPSSEFEYLFLAPEIIPELPEKLPADIINRRPDVRAAISKIEASNLRIAQSKRNLLPGLIINSSGGTSTNDIINIINLDYLVSSLGIAITAPIFNQGRIRSNIKLNEAMQLDAIQNLRNVLIKAFTEVEQLLYLDYSFSKQLLALEISKNQAYDTFLLSKERYDRGLSNLEIVLNSQRQYNDSQSQYINLKRKKLNNYLSIILAFGGDIVEIDNN